MPPLAGISYHPAIGHVTKLDIAKFAIPSACLIYVRVTHSMCKFCQGPIAVIPAYFSLAALAKEFP